MLGIAGVLPSVSHKNVVHLSVMECSGVKRDMALCQGRLCVVVSVV